MDDADAAWRVLTVGLAFSGFGALVWGLASWAIQNGQQHKKIIELLESMQQVELTLDEVLKHPDDTAFSVYPLKQELTNIRKKLDHIDEVLTTLIKR